MNAIDKPAAGAAVADPYDAAVFRAGLIANGFIIPTGVQGADGRMPKFEDILNRFDDLVMRNAAGDGAEEMHFAPILARTLIERMGYLGNFPQLIGSIHSFFGNDAAAQEISALADGGERWEQMLEPAGTMLLPAACYPVYPLFSGLLPTGGRLVTVRNWIYRHEPSDEPTRLQSFRMREFIKVGAPATVEVWRDAWLQRGLELLRGLGMPVASDVAHDPFFGRSGRMMAASQRDQRLKFEIVVPVISVARPTAICSFNWHQDHFTSTFGIKLHDGGAANTACLGFGLERVTLALIKTHGFELADWPAEVRAQLWP